MLKISIVIPVYNVAPYLKECLDSVIGQTVNSSDSPDYNSVDWEAICVDDGSTDESKVILDEYAAKDVRIRVIHQKNAGVSTARNVALDVAQGDWIMFLDGDDVYCPNALNVICRMVREYPEAKIIKFGTRRFNQSEVCVWRQEEFDSRIIDISTRIDDRRLLKHFAEKAYRRDLIKNVRFKRFIGGEDVLFSYEILLSSDKIVDCYVILYGYRYREGSATMSIKSIAFLLNRIDVCCTILELLDAAKKKMPYMAYARNLELLTSESIKIILCLPRVDRPNAWSAWFSGINRILRVKNLPAYYRIALLICRRTRSKFMAVACFFPLLVIRRLELVKSVFSDCDEK